MTKEELIQLSDEGNLSQYELEEFFSQNVCIPRGTTLQYYDGIEYNWIDKINIYEGTEYRIKPSEPVYEWQYMLFGKSGDTYNHCYGIGIGYSTDEEIDEEVYRWVKIEETKRVRQ